MPSFPARPAWRRKRPAPRNATGPSQSLSENITWTRIVEPRERYRIFYRDSNDHVSERTIELQKVGEYADHTYFGVTHAGKFKTFRADRIASVIEQLTTGHEPSIRSQPTYTSELPIFPVKGAVYKIETTAASNRTWTVDLNLYTCSCPEKRIRSGFNYAPGQLGFVCAHMAKAILRFLPANSPGWTPELLKFLADPRRVHIDNLT